jgi:hypothetical protein
LGTTILTEGNFPQRQKTTSRLPAASRRRGLSRNNPPVLPFCCNKAKTVGPMSNAKSELQLIGTRGEPSGLFHLSYGADPNDPMPFILTLTPQYVACAIGKTAPTDIQNYAEQNADKLKAIARSEKARGFTTHTLE